jgi:tetratricopeptide (TPR) repeat protein
VFWAHASNASRLEQSFRDIAELIKVRDLKDPQADVFKLVHDWLRNEKNGPWLLVLDNADDVDVLAPRTIQDRNARVNDGHQGNSGALKQRLLSYLPPRRHGSVLVTTRTRRAAMQIVEHSDIIPVEPMDDTAARALLRIKLGDKNGSDDGVTELAAALDYMPLALAQAAAYIRERAPRTSVRRYLEEYRQNDNKKTSLLNQGAGHLRRDKEASNSVLITWQISFDHIRCIRQSAADLLSLMSFFDRQGIPEALLHPESSSADEHVPAAGIDNGFEDDFYTLRDYSLVTATADEKTFEMHSLVQLATREWLESQQQLDKWRAQFISNLCSELPTGEYENWEKCRALFPHAKAAMAQRPQDKKSLKKWARLLYNAAWYALEMGKADESECMALLSMEVRKVVLGGESERMLRSMDMVAEAKRERGKCKEAEVMHRQVLATREKVLGLEHTRTLTSMNNLAATLNDRGKCTEAEAIYRQALAIKEKVLGPSHPGTLVSLNNLAVALNDQGKYKEAEVMHREVLAQREKVLGLEHPDILISMNNLAYVFSEQCRYDDSLVLYDRVCAMSDIVLGKDHPDTRVRYQDRLYTLALQQQDRTVSPSASTDDGAGMRTEKASSITEQASIISSSVTAENDASMHIGKASKPSRQRAKRKTKSSKHSKR